MKAIHWICVALGVVSAVAMALSQALPAYSVATHAVAVAALAALTALGVTSPSALQPATVAALPEIVRNALSGGAPQPLRFVLTSTSANYTTAALEAHAVAFAMQGEACAREWGSPAPFVVAGNCSTLAGITDVPVVYQDAITVDGAAAYHDNDGGIAQAVVLATLPPPEVQEAAGHEVLEALVDPTCDLYRNGIALEVGDPVQGTGRIVRVNGTDVTVPNFVLKAWFVAGSDGPWDYYGALHAPLTYSAQGYAMDKNGNQLGPSAPAAHKLGPAYRYGARLAKIKAARNRRDRKMLGEGEIKVSVRVTTTTETKDDK